MLRANEEEEQEQEAESLQVEEREESHILLRIVVWRMKDLNRTNSKCNERRVKRTFDDRHRKILGNQDFNRNVSQDQAARIPSFYEPQAMTVDCSLLHHHPLREVLRRIFVVTIPPGRCRRNHPFEAAPIFAMMPSRIMVHPSEAVEDSEAAAEEEDAVGDSFVDGDGAVVEEVVAVMAA